MMSSLSYIYRVIINIFVGKSRAHYSDHLEGKGRREKMASQSGAMVRAGILEYIFFFVCAFQSSITAMYRSYRSLDC